MTTIWVRLSFKTSTYNGLTSNNTPPSFLLGYYLFIINPHLPIIRTPFPKNMLNVLWFINVTCTSNALYCDKLALQSKLWRITKYHSSLNYLLFFAPEIKTILLVNKLIIKSITWHKKACVSSHHQCCQLMWFH